MDREGLADFLRRRRTALQPADVGLAPGRRRRTAGLRREEVAALAHMSTDFYARLEQGRGSRPSQQTVAALARAMRLTQDERDHLFQLAGHAAPPRGYRSDHVTPALMRVLDRLDTPAQIVSDLGVTLAQNPLAEALLGVHTEHTGFARSLMYRWFTDPAERRIYPPDDHELHSRSYVATLRAVHSRNADDAEAQALVERLRSDSREFAELWDEHEVAERRDTRKRMVHAVVGELTLDCQILTSQNQTERLVVFTAAPGTEDAERLELLSVIGAQTFEATA
ncbi:helix-turn-helix transcriptional regulator [Conexibacter sp. CPCC 206217]|uniref:helix-turn-helix transcriptional regulator n=1 Tax=Conexibacter sp. CPCC 206217 TaxID=3064574 RepID=UPI0027260FE4|nr:helix-turn-helix transcriptional regulator [Conexibacter sp. CPCC 206217]MDO8212262.1 helix-turn-helix transcriptional regulator [Conexibacter sp. CPCC 206217]